MTYQTSPRPEHRPSTWDVIFGLILVLLGAFILGNTVIATAVSVLVLGWAAIFGGIAVIIGGLMTRRGGWVLTGLISPCPWGAGSSSSAGRSRSSSG